MITVHGLSGVTLGKVRKLFAKHFLDDDTTDPAFAQMVNEVLERFHMDGEWKGSTGIFDFDVSANGTITLPLFLDSVLQSQQNNIPRPVMAGNYEFLAHGPGQITPTQSGLGMLVDQGLVGLADEFPSTAGVLQLASHADDDTAKVRVLGLDSTGKEVRDDNGIPGELVTLTAPTTNTATTFSDVLGIQKPVTQHSVVVSHVGTSNTELADIPPGVEHPTYRRYKVANAAAVSESAYVRAICSRNPIPVANEEDFIIPGNIAAIKMGLYAITYEEENDLERAEQYWAKAIDFLNKEALKFRGGAMPLMTAWPSGFGIGKTRTIM